VSFRRSAGEATSRGGPLDLVDEPECLLIGDPLQGIRPHLLFPDHGPTRARRPVRWPSRLPVKLPRLRRGAASLIAALNDEKRSLIGDPTERVVLADGCASSKAR
jgi:hypothetical protein